MKTVCLLSGGIDSPVAAYLIGKNDCEVTLLHMDNRPYSDDSNYEKAIDLKNRLEAELCRKIPLYIAPHGPSQESIKEKCRGNLQCVVCKRVMLRVAKKLAQKSDYDAVITLGCVIRGSTSHYDYVCNEVAKGVSKANDISDTTVIFGILTTENIEQAVERAGTKAGNKGSEAAVSAIEMANLLKKI